MRAIELTLSTIIIIIIFLATMLSVVFFFRGGFASAGGATGSLGKGVAASAKEELTNPVDWNCSSQGKSWKCCMKAKLSECQGETYARFYDCYAACAKADEASKCICMLGNT